MYNRTHSNILGMHQTALMQAFCYVDSIIILSTIVTNLEQLGLNNQFHCMLISKAESLELVHEQ